MVYYIRIFLFFPANIIIATAKESEIVMKLNYKRTVCVGFAFFLICTFWQAYDTIIPKILTDHFGMSQTLSGVIMALDNILALFLLPLFGVLSDKTKTKLGKRTPYILVGTLLAVTAFISLSIVDNAQLTKLGNIKDLDSQEVREVLYEYDYEKPLITPDGEEFVVNEKFTLEEFSNIPSKDENGKTPDEYTNYVVPARQSYINLEITGKDPSSIILFIGVLFCALLSMATFRTPAVALMPDVTPAPLRSKANAIINLMGTIGGSLVLVLGIIFATGSVSNSYMSYLPFFAVVVGIMLTCLVVFLSTVRENRFVSEVEGSHSEEKKDEGGDKKLSRGEFTSLILILASVALWYLGYNAVTSKYSVYASNVLNLDYSSTLLVANVAALISYLPVGMLSSKFGRKKMILCGVAMLGTAFLVGSFLRSGTPLAVMMVIFALAGIGWASINVNSFPMVVELARGGNVGKYTGFYYTASMAAQTITPVISGFFMDLKGMTALFPYATIFVCLAFVTMSLVRHGDSKPSDVKIEDMLGDND